MKLKRREKILAASAVGLLAVGGLGLLFFVGDDRSYEDLTKADERLTSEIDSKERQLKEAEREKKRLADWQRRALPPDPALAGSLYQDWLRSLASRVGIRDLTLNSNENNARRDQFTKISITLRGKARLGDLVDFMFEFYKAGYFHQIRYLDAKPIKDSSDLEVNLRIEALSLPQAESKSGLPKDAASELKLKRLQEYREPIVKRNLFAAYVRQREQPVRQTVDPAEFAVVSGITEVDDVAKVWLMDRMKGKLSILGSGDSFFVGQKKGTVRSILPEGTVDVEFDGNVRRLRGGDNLHGGVLLQQLQPQQPASTDDSGDLGFDEGN